MTPRYFIRPLYAETVETLSESVEKHGRVLEVRCHLGHSGSSIAGAIEIELGEGAVTEADEAPG